MAANDVEIPGYSKIVLENNRIIDLKNKNLNLGEIISKLLPYIYVAAGLSMLVVLIMGGISLMLAGGDSAKIDKGYGMIKAALIGFFIVFLSYIITQVMETILGVGIL